MNQTKRYTFVIPFYLPWGWSADYQRQTCLELSKKYKVLVYMKKDRKFILKSFFSKYKTEYPVHKNIKFYIPYDLIPFQRFKIIEKWNDYLSLKIMEYFYLDRKNNFLWIFDPIFYPMSRMFGGKVIFDCVDYLFVKEKYLRNLLNDYQDKLIRTADYFFVNSKILEKIHSPIRKPNKVVKQGFSLDQYRNPAKLNHTFPTDKPVIGFVGAINQRINFKLINNLVKRNPQWNIVLWGPSQDNTDEERIKTEKSMGELSKYKNFITGASDRKYLPQLIKRFDIAIIPYDDTQDFNMYCYPMKIFEYFYIGKPVVSTKIYELEQFPEYIKIARNVKEFENSINYWLKNKLSKKDIKSLRNLAENNSWENKVSMILKNIGYT
jgi:glycosyltransferase involved in cell wall biosynthesis